MAIKVGGTTVIDDSRNLSNIAGGLKTVNSTSLLGSGNIEAGASTTYNAVGTYIYAARPAATLAANSTYSGSSIRAGGLQGPTNGQPYITTGGSLSGTWRAMGNCVATAYSNYYYCTLVVRIS